MNDVSALRDLFRLHTALFANCLADLTEGQAQTRPTGSTNSVAFIAGHLVETRAWTCRFLGTACPPPFGGALEHATAIDQLPAVPSLMAIRAGWAEVSGLLSSRLDAPDGVPWQAQSPQRFPGVADTILGAMAFLVHHESYHIGQLALLRKYLGLPAMKYR